MEKPTIDQIVTELQPSVQHRRIVKNQHIKKRIQTMFSLYAPEELLNLARKNGMGDIIDQKLRDDDMKEVAPGILVGDLLMMKLVMNGLEGKDSSIKLLYQYAYGNPEQSIIIGEQMEDDDDVIEISTEEKIKFLQRFHENRTED
jgi:hypothetical protein